MDLLYSNILPLGTSENQKTTIDCFSEYIAISESLQIAVGYVSCASLEELERLLDSGHKVCYLFVALCPKTKRLHLDFDNQYTSLFNSCIEKGMRYYGCGLKMSSNGFSVVSQLEVIPQ